MLVSRHVPSCGWMTALHSHRGLSALTQNSFVLPHILVRYVRSYNGRHNSANAARSVQKKKHILLRGSLIIPLLDLARISFVAPSNISLSLKLPSSKLVNGSNTIASSSNDRVVGIHVCVHVSLVFAENLP
jgi:hypothetical protein